MPPTIDLSPYKVHVDVQFRFRDTDAMGHVNNAAYLSYLELARMKYWEEVSGITDYSNLGFILVRAEIDYRSPAKPADEVGVYIRAVRLGRSSWDFDYKIVERRTGRLLAEAKTVQCCYDYQRGRARRMDEGFRKRIEEFEGRGGVQCPVRR